MRVPAGVDGILIGIIAAAASLTWASFRMGDAVYDAFRCDKGNHGEDEDARAARREEEEAKLEAALTGGADSDSKTDDTDVESGDKKKEKKKLNKKKGASDGANDDEDEDEAPDDQVQWPFHLVMALGGLYFAMLLTNWGSLETTDLSAALELSTESMWVKMISQYVVMVYACVCVIMLCSPCIPPAGGSRLCCTCGHCLHPCAARAATSTTPTTTSVKPSSAPR